MLKNLSAAFLTLSSGLLLFSMKSTESICQQVEDQKPGAPVSHSLIALLPAPAQERVAELLGTYWAKRRATITVGELHNLFATTFTGKFINMIFNYKNLNRIIINNNTPHILNLMYECPSAINVEKTNLFKPGRSLCCDILDHESKLEGFEMYDCRGAGFSRFFTFARLPIACGGATINIVERNILSASAKLPCEVDYDLLFSRLFTIHNFTQRDINIVIEDPMAGRLECCLVSAGAVDETLAFEFKGLASTTDVISMTIEGQPSQLKFAQLPPFNHAATDIFVRFIDNNFQITCHKPLMPGI